MKVSFLRAILFLFLLGTGGHSLASSDFPWQKVGEGFDYKFFRVEGLPYQSLVKLTILRIGWDQFQVRILDSRSHGADRMEIKALARKAQALAGINGGFFLPGYRPLGLLIVDGKEANPLRKADWGIFLVQDDLPRIIHTTEYQNGWNISQALQVGPRLVVNGRELQMKKQVARRSALGVTMKNQVILLTSEDTDV
ncbi:MAG TPA: phosphodiester glycosidase family protein, partial [Thermodesulfobacteriota bacterium]|nr:phosphodiester glycosidase family protein [Thermodesulfobacteriota bacterium]